MNKNVSWAFPDGKSTNYLTELIIIWVCRSTFRCGFVFALKNGQLRIVKRRKFITIDGNIAKQLSHFPDPVHKRQKYANQPGIKQMCVKATKSC